MTLKTCVLVALCAASLRWLAPAAAVADGPLPLRSPMLATPDEVAGTGLAPEATVRLSIDARGRVSSVEVLSIRPASEHDGLFRAEAIETFSKWRFAPATEQGRPKESQLEWKVKFAPKNATWESAPQVTSRLVGADAEQRRAALLALPFEYRRKILEEEVRAAVAFLDPKATKVTESPRFTVRCDADDERAGKSIATNLEVTFNFLASELLPGIPFQAEQLKLQVVVFRSLAQYEAFSTGRSRLENSAGFYSPAGLIAFHLEMPTPDSILNLMLHEATHAFVDRHLARPGVALPRWLGEGFAEYLGNSAIDRGKLQPGKTLKRKFGFSGPRLLAYQTDAGLRLEDAKRAIRQGSGIGLTQMLEASPETFYGEKAGLYYASSWLAVHYLRDGGPGWAVDRFPRLLLYLAEGYPQEAAFQAIYGSPDTVEKGFREYVKAF